MADFLTGATLIADFQDDAASTAIVTRVGPANGVLTGAGNTSASTAAGPNAAYPKSISLVGTATPDRIVFADHPSLNPTGPFSLGMWIFSTNYKPGSSYGELCAKTNAVAANTPWECRIQQVAGTPEFVVYAGGSLTVHTAADISPLNGTWVHYGASYNGSFLNQYINGVASGAAVAKSGTPGTTTEAVTIGIRNNSSPSLPFTGRVAGFRYFNARALAAADFAAWYADVLPPGVSRGGFNIGMGLRF